MGFGALEIDKTFAGFVGLARLSYETPFTPCVKIGWRICPRYWGKGYAAEAALVSLLYGFEEADIEEIVSFTSLENTPSQNVMKRLGMSRNVGEDFNHPKLEEVHPLSRHCLYRLGNSLDAIHSLRKNLASFKS